jgi:hypothetical protein
MFHRCAVIERIETMDGVMLRLSLSYFYDLARSLEPIRRLNAGDKLQGVWPDVYGAENALRQFLAIEWLWGSIKSSYSLGNALLSSLANLRQQDIETYELNYYDTYTIQGSLAAYEPVLRADLSVTDTYFVTRKGGYDTLALIQNAEVLCPAALNNHVPDAIPDLREAGKCLAYELCTAAGIHVLRAFELVLKAYFKVVTNGKPLPKNRNIGAYLKALDGVADPKILAVLTQIKDLHRNSLMHPEDSLSRDDAIALFGIVFSAMAAMIKNIPPINPSVPVLGRIA